MNRCLIGLSVITAALVWLGPADAQSTAPRPRSPAEINAASELLIVKNEACHREAREQKLSFMKRRLFIHHCLHH